MLVTHGFMRVDITEAKKFEIWKILIHYRYSSLHLIPSLQLYSFWYDIASSNPLQNDFIVEIFL